MTKKNETQNDWLTRDEAAEYLRVSPVTLRNWAYTGRHNLPYYRHGQRVLYKRSELDEWLESQKRTHA